MTPSSFWNCDALNALEPTLEDEGAKAAAEPARRAAIASFIFRSFTRMAMCGELALRRKLNMQPGRFASETNPVDKFSALGARTLLVESDVPSTKLKEAALRPIRANLNKLS